jgi:23S rRNA pseudouridine955/2504/2580 synthase
MKRYTVIIPDNQPIMHMSQYLKQAFPLLPGLVIRNAFKKRDIKQDGIRISADDIVIPGAMVTIFTPFDASIDVVYEDDLLIIVNKPAGISVADDGRGGQTVISWAEERSEGKYVPRLCHRLDNQTTGLLVIAKTTEAEAIMLHALKNRSIIKKYTCLVKGIPVPDQAVLKAYLQKDSVHATVRILDMPVRDAKTIITQYQVMERGSISRLQINLITGRTHQIRAHMAFVGHPILGDDKYGDRLFNKINGAEHLHLCATSMEFHIEGCLNYLDGRFFDIKAPF